MSHKYQFPQLRACPPRHWQKLQADVQKLFASPPLVLEDGDFKGRHVILGGPDGSLGTVPLITSDEISFNGAPPASVTAEEMKLPGADSYWMLTAPKETKDQATWETFWISQRRNTEPYLKNCKTNGLPYDVAVCAVLILMELHAPNVWDITSTASVENFERARAWIERVLGHTAFDQVMKITEKKPDAPSKPTEPKSGNHSNVAA